MKQKKLGLSIRGAAAEGPAYIGALRALHEERIRIDMIITTSAGSLVGAAYAFGWSFEEMEERMRSLTYAKFINFDSIKEKSFISIDAMMKYSDECFGKVNIEDAKIPLFIQVTNIKTGESEILEKGPLNSALLAACSMPPIMKPIKISDNEYIDGGYSVGYNASFLRGKGVEAVVGVTIESKTMFQSDRQDPLNYLYMMVKTIHEQDLKLDPVDYLLDDLGSHDVGILDFKEGMKLIDRGYHITKSRIPEIKSVIQKKSFFSFLNNHI